MRVVAENRMSRIFEAKKEVVKEQRKLRDEELAICAIHLILQDDSKQGQ
jgi:hypothetical protein